MDCRLLIDDSDFHKAGAMNMAIDEVLLKTASETKLPTLRFYGWKPATLSLGYFQKLEDRELHSASLPCDVVRRASGGGAIMHDNELTYAFAAPSKARWGAEQMYLAFHETLVDVLAEQNVAAKLHSAEEGLTDDAFLCFQRRASGDITTRGHKITGSAQRRWKNALLQHGSVLLAQSPYAPELPGLREITGFSLEPKTLIPIWLHKLASRLKVNFLMSRLTDSEIEGANVLKEQKFSGQAWIGRR